MNNPTSIWDTYLKPQSETHQDFMYSDLGKKEVDYTSLPSIEIAGIEEAYEGEWLHKLVSCFDGGWTENYMSLMTEDSYKDEEQYTSYRNYFVEVEENPNYDYNNPWSCHDSGLQFGEEDSCDDNAYELKCMYPSSVHEMGLYETIFGHWMCLFADNQRNLNEVNKEWESAVD